MSSPIDPQPPAEPTAQAQPTTQEIPVAVPTAAAQQLPPHPGATTPAPVETVQKTGPVGFVPGLPGPLPPPPPPAPAPTVSQPAEPEAVEAISEPRDRAALRSLGLVAVALVLLELGLGLRFGSESFWSDIPLWSTFATVCGVLGLACAAGLLPAGRRPRPATSWRIAAGGLVGLAVFWLLVVLPVVAGDRGFLLTAALGCLGAALWTGPARRS